MKLPSKNWRRRLWLTLLAALPVAASIAVFGASSPASAWQVVSGCNNYQTCYYGDNDFVPTSAVLNVGREYIPNWTQITPGASVACTLGNGNGQNWNDCASSVKDRQTAVDMCSYENVDYQGIKLLILHGEQIPALSQYGFNDIISSNHYTTVPSC